MVYTRRCYSVIIRIAARVTGGTLAPPHLDQATLNRLDLTRSRIQLNVFNCSYLADPYAASDDAGVYEFPSPMFLKDTLL